jgi:hypothetical protein
MKSVLRNSTASRITAVLLALFFVFPPEAIGRVSCATFAVLSLPMRCCAARSSVAGESHGRRSCCCAPEVSRPSDSDPRSVGTSGGRASVKSPDGCSCSKTARAESAGTPVRDASVADLASWIAGRASDSARAVHFEPSMPSPRLCTHLRGPPVSGIVSAGLARAPAAGCARHDLLSRGISGLLTEFGVALL